MGTIGALAVTSRAAPPEGALSANFQVNLTPIQPSIAYAWQLNSQAGLLMSQVQAIYVDNETGQTPVTLIHGALNETTVVPAFATAIVPTLSNAGNFAVSVSAGEITSNQVVNLVLYNTQRRPGMNSNALSNSIQGVQNTSPLFSGIVDAAAPGNINIVSATNFLIIDSIDFSIEGVTPIANGSFACLIQLTEFFGSTAPNPQAVASVAAFGSGVAGTFVAGKTLSWAVKKTFIRGLKIPDLSIYTPITPILNNVQHCYVRANVSGVSL